MMKAKNMTIPWKKIGIGAGIFTVFIGAVLSWRIFREKHAEKTRRETAVEEPIETKHYPAPEKPPLPAPSMDILKKKGCVADGILSGYEGKLENTVNMFNRSKCKYLHRAVDTWLKPPSFSEVKKRKGMFADKNMVFGLFFAEAVDKKADYYYPAEDRPFDFDKMCRPGSDNFWGEHTCKPSFARSEYRKYIRYVTEEAVDAGIQVFLFGQIFYQENSDLARPVIKDIIQEMREYAAFKGTSILIGAQTNDITDENYLRLFDFIEGGVGISEEGTVEDGPCFSRWWKKEGDWCWALLWNEKFKKRANNVILHLDWGGKIGDDMDIFARMDREKRRKTLSYLYNYFISRNDGFLLPMLAALDKENNGCHGDKKRYYSADRKYTCQDEDAINAILNGKLK